jgi:uncharacterized lipoprotein YddW (UPF0748 family)
MKQALMSMLIVVITGFLPWGTTLSGQTSQPQFRAFWVDAFHYGFKSPGEVNQLVADAQTANVNALVVQVRRRGDSYYLNSLEPITEDPDFFPRFDALQYLVDRAHSVGIEVHAWIAVIPIWNRLTPPISPQHVFNLHGPSRSGDDNWIMTSNTGETRNGEGDYLLDPAHPAAADYTLQVAMHIVRNYDIDGLHLDRVRYYGRTWGYNPVAVSRFNSRYGRTGTPAADDPDWLAWRREQLTALIRRLYLSIMAEKPRVKVSVAATAFSNPPTSNAGWLSSDPFAYQLQDWRGWLEEGIIDIAMPMNYDPENTPSRAARFDGWTEWEKDHRYNRHMVIGQAAYLNDIAGSIRQTRRALSPSSQGNLADGIVFYSYWTNNNAAQPPSDFYRALSQPSAYDTNPSPVFAERVPPPEMAWKISPLTGLILGTVSKPDGRKVDGATVVIHSADRVQSSPVSRTITDGSGTFGFVGLDPGSYQVGMMGDGPLLHTSSTVQIDRGKVSSVSLILQ